MKTWKQFCEAYGTMAMQDIHRQLKSGSNPVVQDVAGQKYEVLNFNDETVGLHDLQRNISLRYPRHEFEDRLLDGRIKKI